MLPSKRNPAPRAAGRASDVFCSAAERPEDSRTHLSLQARKSYEASRIKRQRATSEMEVRRSVLIEIVASAPPMTTRQVFYQATVRGLVEKTEAGYDKVQRELVRLRLTHSIPYGWIADNTRWQRRPRTFDSPQHALQATAEFYRKSLWAFADSRVEIWLEKDALAGVILDVTSETDVPLMVTRGYPSLSFLAEAADDIAGANRPTFVYHLGDYDPSGQDAARVTEQRLRELAPHVEIRFDRLAVTPPQIREMDLPTRPTKKSDSRAKGFGDISVELDAIPPDDLRAVVREAIERHLPRRQLEVMKVAERSERDILRYWAREIGATP
jgi:hypothetical protein